MANEQGVGRRHARALFVEWNDKTDDVEPIYSLKEFHDTFLAMEDVTEYGPAMKLVGDWKEWGRLKRDCPSFQREIDSWKQELDIKLTSVAIQKVKELSYGDDPKALQAAKWIAENGWEKRGKGRPSEQQKQREAKQLAEAAAETEAERTRIFAVVNGGRN